MTDEHKDRAFALDRALKMAKLFKKKNFDDIMKTLDPPNKKDFETACSGAGLVTEEVIWLWNYLEHYSEANRLALPDAAGSGW